MGVREGRAESTGLEPGSFDVVMMRHVLAHNGRTAQATTASPIRAGTWRGRICSARRNADSARSYAAPRVIGGGRYYGGGYYGGSRFYGTRFVGSRVIVGYPFRGFARPYYSFRPRFSIGFGIYGAKMQ